jgi:hypothetical protein
MSVGNVTISGWKSRTIDRPLYNNVLDVKFSGESSDPVEPVGIIQLKRRLRIDEANADFDTLLDELRKEVRDLFEQTLGISLIKRTITAILQNELGNIELPYDYADSTVTVVATDKQGNAINATDYDLRGTNYRVLETVYDWIQIQYGVDPVVPLGLRMCILREIIYRFEHNGDEKLDSEGIHVKEALKYSRKTWLL